MKNFILFFLFSLIGLSSVFAQMNLDSGLVAKYYFNGNANDESGNGNNGTINGATPTTDRFGNANKAYSFNGTSDYIQLNSSSTLNPTSALSISVWIKSSSISTITERLIFDNNYSLPWYGYNLQLEPNNNSIKFGLYTSASFDCYDSTMLPINNWQHILVLYDGQYTKIFLNNYLVDSCNVSGLIDYSVLVNPTIGCRFNHGSQFFEGNIDDIRIYNRALNTQEIQALYQEGGWSSLNQGLVAYYPFNGNANDESGNANNGTVNGATLTTDRFGNTNKAYSFDGVSNKINCPANGMQNYNYSYSVWVKVSSLPTYSNSMSIVSIGDNVSGDQHIQLQNNYSGFSTLDFAASAYMTPLNVQFNSQVTPNFVDWYFLTLTKDSSFLKLYVNGVLKNSVSVIGKTPIYGTPELAISCRAIGNIQYFSGILDDIRIYNRALSTQEIQALYNESSNSSLTVTDIDGNVYNTVTIGTQVWLKENLKATHYADGTLINAGIYDYNDDPNNSIIYGKLYNWAGALNIDQAYNTTTYTTTFPHQGVCPTGWHIPSKNEWQDLEIYLGMSPSQASTQMQFVGTNESGKLKETGTAHWNSPNTGATNESGFTALSGGGTSYGSYMGLNTYAMFWASDQNSTSYAWNINLVHNDARIFNNASFKTERMSVRCLKNTESVLINPPTTQNSSRCGSGSITLTASGATGSETYKWFATATDTTVLATSASYTITNLLLTDTFYVALDSAGNLSSRVPAIAIINLVYVSNNPIIICQGQSYIFNGHTYTIAGTYNDTLQTINSCDSIIVTNLTVNPVYTSNNPVSICQGQNYIFNGHTYTTTGIYNDTLQSINGCDSIIVTNLTINPLPVVNLGNDTTICSNATITLFASGIGNYFQWNNGLNSPSITVSTSGNFVVTVTSAFGCIASDNITISMHSPINITVNTVNTACGQQNGVASAFVTGGTSPYNYLWNNGDTTNTAISLNAGVYIVYVADANNCQNSALGVVSTTNGPVISNTPQITNVSCFGGNDGAISITVIGGVLPYHFEWSNGDTINQNISNLTTGPYEIIVTDANNCQAVRSINVTQPTQIAITISSTNATCGNADGEATATVTGGTQPYTYIWNNGNSTANNQSLAANSYSLTVIDSHSCIATAAAAISESGAATIMIDSIVNSSCGSGNGAVYISVSGGTNFTYNWSDLSTLQDLTGVSAGTYNVTVTSSGCNAVAQATITEIQPLLQPICIITVDNTTLINRNMLIWEKQQTIGISHYKIWKETTQAGVYQVVTTIPYLSMSKWTDPNSNPHQRSWRYKISAVDSCGTESPLSIVHKTMHLTVNLGQGQDINLIWNHYQGFDYYTYYIHRYRPGTGWEVIDSIPGDLNTYTDTPLGGGAVRYFVAAKRDNECWSSGTAKDMSGPFSQSLSNIEDNGIIDVSVPQTKIDELNCKIYPNPANDKFTIELSKSGIAEIIDLQGRIIKSVNLQNTKTIIDLQDYYSGIYSIRIITDKEIIVRKLVKQ